MKKWAVSIGIILLILTPIILASYNTAYGTASTTAGPWPLNANSWEYSANYNASDTILAGFSPNINWFNNSAAFDLTDSGQSVMYVDFNITDPAKGESQYELWLTFDQTNYRWSFINQTLLYNATGISATVGPPYSLPLAPNFHVASGIILGTAVLNGTYFANVTFVGYIVNFRDPSSGNFPPSNFVLNWATTTLQKSYPLANLIYGNFFTIPGSVLFLVYGLKKTKKNSIRKMPKRESNTRHSH